MKSTEEVEEAQARKAELQDTNMQAQAKAGQLKAQRLGDATSQAQQAMQGQGVAV